MNTLGTVLPNKETVKINERYAKRVELQKESIADKRLKGTTRKVVGGEVRYYDTADQYAIVTRQGAVIWFAVRADGDYRI